MLPQILISVTLGAATGTGLALLYRLLKRRGTPGPGEREPVSNKLPEKWPPENTT